MIWTDNMLIPQGGTSATASTYMNYVYDPKVAAQIAAYVNYVTPVKGAKEELAKTDPETAKNPLHLPDRRDALAGAPVRLRGAAERRVPSTPGRRCSEPETPAGGRLARTTPMTVLHRHRWLAPMLLLLPGLAWLASSSSSRSASSATSRCRSGSFLNGYSFTWAFANYTRRALASTASSSSARSSTRASRRCSALLIAYPLAYWIAFRAGRWKNLFLVVIVAPFFVTYLDPDARLAQHPRRRGPGRRCPPAAPRPRPGRAPARDLRRGRRRDHLQLPAVHGAAALRLARADRRAPARGGERPLREHARRRSSA